jgi:hypothetical protein
VAFLGSLIALAIPLLLLYKRTERLAPCWRRAGR